MVCKDNEKVLKSMLGRIAHRGPDSEDVYIDTEIAIGFRRLSIIDLYTGSQPIYNEDRSKVLVFNGEIYNYKTLRKDLVDLGHTFTTQTDSEVLVHGYEEYGKDLLMKLRGMFSFVIWDTKSKKIFAARDFFGIKPFYYSTQEKTFMFSSEIKSFLEHPDFKKELNEEKLYDYLTFGCVPGNDTFFKNTYKLPPGHYLEYQNGKVTVTRYFTPEFKIENGRTMNYFVDKIVSEVTNSVAAHKISDVEVGCFLSSGVDSSYLASELAKLGEPRPLPQITSPSRFHIPAIFDFFSIINPSSYLDTPQDLLNQKNKISRKSETESEELIYGRGLKTYTIGFEDKRYSEADDAQKFAQEIGVSNKTKIVSSEEYFDCVGKVQYHLDEPLANPSANLLYFVSETAAKDLKVVLSGEGADEMFGGYNVYKEPLSLEYYQKLPLYLRKALASMVGTLPDFKGKNFIIRGSKTIEERYIGNSNIFSAEEKAWVLKNKYKTTSPQEYFKPVYDEVKMEDDVTKMQYVDIHFWMVQEILLKADKMSMAHSLELRVPFLDKEIFNIARTIPLEYKVSRKNTKLAFRDAARRNMLEISADRRKLAFPLPLVEWLREDKYYSKIKSYFTSVSSRRFFNEGEILKFLDEHKSGRRNNARKIWAIFTFLVWYEEFFIKVK